MAATSQTRLCSSAASFFSFSSARGENQQRARERWRIFSAVVTVCQSVVFPLSLSLSPCVCELCEISPQKTAEHDRETLEIRFRKNREEGKGNDDDDDDDDNNNNNNNNTHERNSGVCV